MSNTEIKKDSVYSLKEVEDHFNAVMFLGNKDEWKELDISQGYIEKGKYYIKEEDFYRFALELKDKSKIKDAKITLRSYLNPMFNHSIEVEYCKTLVPSEFDYRDAWLMEINETFRVRYNPKKYTTEGDTTTILKGVPKIKTPSELGRPFTYREMDEFITTVNLVTALLNYKPDECPINLILDAVKHPGNYFQSLSTNYSLEDEQGYNASSLGYIYTAKVFKIKDADFVFSLYTNTKDIWSEEYLLDAYSFIPYKGIKTFDIDDYCYIFQDNIPEAVLKLSLNTDGNHTINHNLLQTFNYNENTQKDSSGTIGINNKLSVKSEPYKLILIEFDEDVKNTDGYVLTVKDKNGEVQEMEAMFVWKNGKYDDREAKGYYAGEENGEINKDSKEEYVTSDNISKLKPDAIIFSLRNIDDTPLSDYELSFVKTVKK